MIKRLKMTMRKLFFKEEFPYLRRAVIELNNFQELKKIYGWKNDPILDRPDIYDYDHIEDVNERRIRDAESLAVVMRNTNPKTAVEIGTADGMATVLMSINAPDSKICTINIPPEEVHSGKGGKLTTIALEKVMIGRAYRERKLSNIIQLYINSAKWKPDIGIIDVSLIDGCHDSEYVYHDTRTILEHMRKGSFVLWHDFNLDLADKYYWIHSVCIGVEKLFQDGLINGRIFHVRDSWVGIYRIE